MRLSLRERDTLCMQPAPAPAPAAEPKAEAPAQPKKSSGTEELHVSDDEDAAAIKEASRG